MDVPCVYECVFNINYFSTLSFQTQKFFSEGFGRSYLELFLTVHLGPPDQRSGHTTGFWIIIICHWAPNQHTWWIHNGELV
jgi:hypothetical protein